MSSIEIIHFNPKRRMFKGMLGHLLPIKRPVNNFGDLLGPEIVAHILSRAGLSNSNAFSKFRLLTVGSILHFAKTGDVIWGTGVNGKISLEAHDFNNLDVRAVRGPLTRAFLMEKNIIVPEVYGDPGLITPMVFPHLKVLAKNPKFDVTFIPNYNDLPFLSKQENILNPCSGLMKCLEKIAQSKFVVGSSLHAIIIAESLGIPARLIKSSVENDFKYNDYYLGTGRSNIQFANDYEHALELGGAQAITIDIIPSLTATFPYDLWQKVDG